ncbi:hypothetical protein NS506_02650 [Nocardia seriolae]|uniref:Uncharacterized protein n=1 Tax=Nocardia seriolae TaxID=37332 RepID=A0ABC8ARJ4_9NOCA|nr:hypothetical protein NS506_02650 [Nocardia seriolae]
MLWDTWALLSIFGLCVTVIAWAFWGFYRDAHPGGDARSLHLTLLDGEGHLEVPARRGGGRRYRGQHRAA